MTSLLSISTSDLTDSVSIVVRCVSSKTGCFVTLAKAFLLRYIENKNKVTKKKYILLTRYLDEIYVAQMHRINLEYTHELVARARQLASCSSVG